MKFSILIILISFVLASCSTPVSDSGPSGNIDVSAIPDAEPRNEPHSKQGNMSSYEVFGKRYHVLNSAAGFKERGVASWYGNKFHGNKTSNGEIYDMYAMTAAHKRLPLPSYVRVTNLNNKRSVVVRVNDRGPFHKGRIIDLSYVAAKKLGITKSGTAPVEVESLRGINSHTTKTGVSDNETVAVQVGAFSLRSSADKVRKQVGKRFNLPVSISEVYVRGKLLFRVRLGPFDSINLARDWIRKLDRTSFGPASLVYLN